VTSPFFINLFSEVTAQSRYNHELVAAKEEFQRISGQIMDTDRSYDARVNAFHNWYILDRELSDKNATPAKYFLEYNRNTFDADTLAGYAELQENVHSVFQLLKFKKDAMTIRDLMTNKKYNVEEANQLATMEPGEVFNSRIFKHGKLYYLSNYVIVHPQEVVKSIRAEAKRWRKSKKSPKPFLFQLLFFHSRWEQFTQWDVRNIYRFDGETSGATALQG